jgi:asparagine synthase (glutamine-hydrolysing)
MCGVFGWFSRRRPLTDREIRAARRSTELLLHRGPDHGGEWHTDRVYMGHQRLKIIDLSAAANQPFHTDDARITLCYNGEIYNYLELCAELKARGCSFRTNSDTEVLVRTIETWGEGAFARLDGMFAGGFHDRRGDRHTIFRDPLGQKPLYYHLSDDHLIYASELRSLLELDVFSWHIDRTAFAGFLANGYYAGADTPIAGIRKLLPGHAITIAGGEVEMRRYWHSIPGDDVCKISDKAALDRLDAELTRACRIAMRCDVPFGVFLSGGIDSSLVLSYCRRENPDVQAISIAVADADFDESAKARTVAEAIGVKRHTVATMDQGAVVSTLETLFAMNDEPHGDPGFINARFLAEASKPSLTVGLAGDGGDELFYGYAPFHANRLRPLLHGLPKFAIAACNALVRALPAHDGYLALRFKAEALLRGYPARGDLDFPLWLTTLAPEGLRRLTPGCADALDRRGAEGTFLAPVRALLDPERARTPAQRLAYYYQQYFLPEFVCMHTDRAAMQVALEVRAPLLSPKIIAFANGLPDRLKYRHGEGKWLLRRLAERRGLGSAIASQRKQGFTLPMARWLKSCLKPHLLALLDRGAWERDPNLIDFAVLQRLVEDHLAGRENNYRILFNLMAFRAWRLRYDAIGSVEHAEVRAAA